MHAIYSYLYLNLRHFKLQSTHNTFQNYKVDISDKNPSHISMIQRKTTKEDIINLQTENS